MINFRELNLNLGLPNLFQDWKKFFSSKDLFADLLAGTTVTFVAIPLSLAIALASGVSPSTGLITAVVAGIVCALFGGTPLAVSGPAAAMCVLIADVVEKFGVQSLILICCIAGVMQLLSGILGLGKVARYVPLPVIAGFTAGIGVIILIGQLPRAFGMMPPPESNVISVLNHLKEYLHEINGTCVLLVVITIAIIRGLPKLFPKLPSILPAVIITSLIAYHFDLVDVPLIGAIPNSLPAPQLPKITDIGFQDLIVNAFIIYLLASLETLLSSNAVDKLAPGKKHDADQELIGQGLGNIATSLFSGIPITGVIARSATNVRAGAKTRRASIIHSLIILVAIFVAAPFIAAIPIAALAGVLFSVAFSMIDYKEFYNLWITTRSEAIIYAVTFFTIIFVDLLAGVQAGITAACLIVLWRTTKTHLHISSDSQNDMLRLSLVGALTFLSTGKIADLQNQLATKHCGQTIAMDLSNIRNLDMSGATAIVDLFNYCRSKNIHFFIKGLPRRFESIFKMCGGTALLKDWYLVSEHEIRKKIANIAPRSAHGRLVHGFNRFYVQSQHDDKRLFEFISQGQDPHTIFITCSDSRIDPSLITSTDPGELFIIRNIGNVVPLYENSAPKFSEPAALEFALRNFDITDIVVCGHLNCGAIKASQEIERALPPPIEFWINFIRSQLKITDDANDMAYVNVRNQINNLKQYSIVQEKLAANTLSIHGWFFDFDKSMVYEWNPKQNDFVSIIPVTAM